MTLAHDNRFEDFFADHAYVALKNLLYNYRLRKRAIKNASQGQETGLTLEVGSGLSPVTTDSGQVIYSDLSFPALRNLKMWRATTRCVVADATRLPFRSGVFATVVCSEVLEHVPDDRGALREMAGVMKKGGSLIMTFPHKRGYFAVDDRFVNHLRRYEIHEMEERLREVGLKPLEMQKVLGPLEKVTMMTVASILVFSQRLRGDKGVGGGKTGLWPILVPLFKWANHLLLCLMWLDARITPRSLSAVVLIRAEKSGKTKTSGIPEGTASASLPGVDRGPDPRTGTTSGSKT